MDKNDSGNQSAEIQALRDQISDLRREAAKYRINARSAEEEKQSMEELLKNLQDELALSKRENLTAKRTALLDKAGCISSELVAGIIPDECEDIQGWIDNYKKENELMFRPGGAKHGGGFKPAASNNLSPSEMMNMFIRRNV